MTRVAINKDDKDRAILTDALPYETPIIFSNEGLYKYKKKSKTILYQEAVTDENSVAKNLLYPKKGYTIPFEFNISNHSNSVRKLSVVHPKSQLDMAEFYAKFDHQIIHLCSLSPSSLRFPSSVANHYYESSNKSKENNHKSSSVEEGPNSIEGQLKYASSYFAYKKYNFLYKFYDSFEFIGLEKKFHNFLMFDISKCFKSIYTHSISWAVKDKEFSKLHKESYSFESEFDKLMQGANYNETNGIVIGPEISRIFAEIILQRVERDAIREIRKDIDAVHGIDYAIRRYIDDYYVFTSSNLIEEKVFSTLIKHLDIYKLHVNESKTEYMYIPFSTSLTRARSEIVEYLDREINDIYKQPSNVVAEFNKFSVSKKWISHLKGIIKSNLIAYYGVSSLVITRLKSLLISILNGNLDCELDRQQCIRKVIDLIFDVIFFVYSMDTRVRTTYLVSQAIIHANHSIKKYSPGIAGEIRKRIFDESLHILRSSKEGSCVFQSEKQNLLIALSDLGDNYHIPQMLLAEITGFKYDTSSDKFLNVISHDYFQIISILFYIKDTPEYANIFSAIESVALSKIKNRPDIQYFSEHVMLMFDMLSCPYVSLDVKNQICSIAVVASGGSSTNKNGINGKFLNLCTRQDWFTSWSSYVDIWHLLNKKELKAPYE